MLSKEADVILKYKLLYMLHCLGGGDDDTDSNGMHGHGLWRRPQLWFQELFRTFHVAVGLWHLANGDGYRSTSLQFGIGKSTAQMICVEFERALGQLKAEFIVFHLNSTDVAKVMSKFDEDYEIPQISGAIDGSHIRIIAPSENRENYFNRKCYYSVNLQAIVDSILWL